MTPGTQPQRAKRKTMRNEPHPLSMTANGGKNIAKSTLNNDISKVLILHNSYNTDEITEVPIQGPISIAEAVLSIVICSCQ